MSENDCARSAWINELNMEDGGLDKVVVSEFPSTNGDVFHCDYLIIGAGMTGSSLAYHISRQGSNKTCCVVDARHISGGASGRNGGISHPRPDRPFEMRTAAALKHFISTEMGGLERACYREGLGANLFAESNAQGDGAETENPNFFDPTVEMHAKEGAFPGFGSKDGNVASFWPAKVVHGLARSATQGGCPAIFVNNCRVLTIDEDNDDDDEDKAAEGEGAKVRVTTSLGSITARMVIVATNAWTGQQLLPQLKPYFKAVSNTVLCSKSPVPEHLRWGEVVSACSGEGAEEVYATLRHDGRLIVGGFRARQSDYGSEFDATDGGNAEEAPTAAIRGWLEKCFPSLFQAVEDSGGFEYAWKGLIGNTVDSVPLAGDVPGHRRVKVCAGFNGHGMPRCFGLARVLVQELEGAENIHAVDQAYLDMCRVSRFDAD